MSRSALALVLVVVTVAAGFGPRTVLHRRRHGDLGWRGPGTTRGVIAHVLLVGAGVLLVVAVVGDAGLLAGAGWLVVAVGLVVGGTVLTLVAQQQMGESWRVGVDPTERTPLVTRGLFAHVRNPIFTGMALSVLGIAALVPNLVALAALGAGLAGLEVQVRLVEEPYLRATHGRAYDRWAAQAGRFLPGVGRLSAAPREPVAVRHRTTS